MSSSVETLTMILAVLSIVGPAFFGFIIWKLSSTFLTKEEYKKDQEIIWEKLKWHDKWIDDLRFNKSKKENHESDE